MSAQATLSEVSDTRQIAFRKACAAFTTGVAVVSVRTPEGVDTGMVINSFASVSLRPMLVQWALARSAPNFACYAPTVRYGISILGADQAGLVPRFAGGAEKFLGLPELRSMAGTPWVSGATAHFCARVIQRVPAGDHLLLIAEVSEFKHVGGRPLLFMNGRIQAGGAVAS